ncbi:nad-dependent epimerase dehydratase [Gracilaria domingensis]|nr:nad-dependent epimerase dehydratase [Gracilaria domingensis]
MLDGHKSRNGYVWLKKAKAANIEEHRVERYCPDDHAPLLACLERVIFAGAKKMPLVLFVASTPLPTVLNKRCSHLSLRTAPIASQAGVVGATGGLGKAIVKRLLDSTRLSSSTVTSVNAFVRDPQKANKFLPSNEPALVITKLPASEDIESLRNAFCGVSYMIVCVGTTAFPTKDWRNGNTPSAIDDVAVSQWLKALDERCIRRIVYVSSIGVARKSSFPYFILNAFGVLDAKQKGESHVLDAARRLSCAYAILRPGRLVGGPHTNVGALRAEPNPSKLNIQIEMGDCVNGEISRSATAEIAAISAVWDDTKDLDMCFVNTAGEAPNAEQLREKMKTCEL